MDKEWAVWVNGALNAYFNQPDGTSRPGGVSVSTTSMTS